jgi:hypothetical protein
MYSVSRRACSYFTEMLVSPRTNDRTHSAVFPVLIYAEVRELCVPGLRFPVVLRTEHDRKI